MQRYDSHRGQTGPLGFAVETAAQQQAEADGSPGELPECPQLSLSVRHTELGEQVNYSEGNIIYGRND